MSLTPWAISYENLNSSCKLSRLSDDYLIKEAKDLYANFMTSEWDIGWDRIIMKDILRLSSSEANKEKLMFFCEQLNNMWKDLADVCNNLDEADLENIKNATDTDKVNKLLDIIQDKFGFSNEQKLSIQKYIKRQINLSNQKAEKDETDEAALRYWSTNRISHIWSKINATFKKYENNGGYANKDCYMKILRQWSYIHNNLWWKTWRRILPWKFNWRNISKQTKKTLDELDKRKANPSSALEKRAVELVQTHLKNAYEEYKKAYDKKKWFLSDSDFNF